MLIDFSYTASRKERQRYENNFSLGINCQGPKPGPMKKRADYPQAVNKVLVMRKQVGDPHVFFPRDRLIRQTIGMDKLVRPFFFRINDLVAWLYCKASLWTSEKWQA